MKRDNDLIKHMLQFAEESDDAVTFSRDALPEGFPMDVSFKVVWYHFGLLLDYGLIEGAKNSQYVKITGLTWKGHDFLDDARNDTVWNSVKKVAGNFSFTTFQAVLFELAKQYTMSHLPGLFP